MFILKTTKQTPISYKKTSIQYLNIGWMFFYAVIMHKHVKLYCLS